MARQKEPAMSYEGALNEYYGGVKGLSGMGIPFKCRCGGTTYREKTEDDIEVSKPVMHIEDIFKRIRSVHKERIKKYYSKVLTK